MSERTGPLADVRVVDLTQALAGPFCTMLLADLGADVIKVEPIEGDAMRIGSPFVGCQRGKRDISLDLKSKEGRAVFYDLARTGRALEWWVHFTYQARSLRRTGSTALNLAYVAAGRFDGFWAFDNHPWDVAAGVVLVREAGGTVSHADGSPFDPFRPEMAASNGRRTRKRSLYTSSSEALTPPASAARRCSSWRA